MHVASMIMLVWWAKAMTNAHYVFFVTDSQGAGYDYEKEVQMGKNGIDAAKEVHMTEPPVNTSQSCRALLRRLYMGHSPPQGASWCETVG